MLCNSYIEVKEEVYEDDEDTLSGFYDEQISHKDSFGAGKGLKDNVNIADEKEEAELVEQTKLPEIKELIKSLSDTQSFDKVISNKTSGNKGKDFSYSSDSSEKSSQRSSKIIAEKKGKNKKKKVDQSKKLSSKVQKWQEVKTHFREDKEINEPIEEGTTSDLFNKIYSQADEDTKLALKKSFQVSHGTVQSTNWDDLKEIKSDSKEQLIWPSNAIEVENISEAQIEKDKTMPINIAGTEHRYEDSLQK